MCFWFSQPTSERENPIDVSHTAAILEESCLLGPGKPESAGSLPKGSSVKTKLTLGDEWESSIYNDRKMMACAEKKKIVQRNGRSEKKVSLVAEKTWRGSRVYHDKGPYKFVKKFGIYPGASGRAVEV